MPRGPPSRLLRRGRLLWAWISMCSLWRNARRLLDKTCELVPREGVSNPACREARRLEGEIDGHASVSRECIVDNQGLYCPAGQHHGLKSAYIDMGRVPNEA